MSSYVFNHPRRDGMEVRDVGHSVSGNRISETSQGLWCSKHLKVKKGAVGEYAIRA